MTTTQTALSTEALIDRIPTSIGTCLALLENVQRWTDVSKQPRTNYQVGEALRVLTIAFERANEYRFGVLPDAGEVRPTQVLCDKCGAEVGRTCDPRGNWNHQLRIDVARRITDIEYKKRTDAYDAGMREHYPERYRKILADRRKTTYP
jgi:hypothetical protein